MTKFERFVYIALATALMIVIAYLLHQIEPINFYSFGSGAFLATAVWSIVYAL